MLQARGYPANAGEMLLRIKVVRVYQAGEDHPNINLKTPRRTGFDELRKGDRFGNDTNEFLKTLFEQREPVRRVILRVADKGL